MRFFKRSLAAFLALGLSAGAETAWAWGFVGHRTIAWIASDRLSPEARDGVARLLGPGQTLVSVSCWADLTARRRPETAPWHYVNLSVRETLSPSDLEAACRGHDCVVDQIGRDLDVLTDSNARRRDKREALKFLVHFVGDLHQPLHCAEDGDRGGNDKWFRWHGNGGFSARYTWVNFHSFWDNLLEPHAREDPRGLSADLEKEIDPADERTWTRGNAADWAFESYRIAKKEIYRNLPAGPLPRSGRWGRDLPEEYYSGKMKVLVRRQLEKAGVRLAFLLNGVFRKE